MSVRETLERVQEVAAEAGLKGRVDAERELFEMAFQLDPERTQTVFIRDTSTAERPMVTVFSPCLVIKKGLLSRLTREMALELLRANETLRFARYGIWESETETMVVASSDHVLATLDPPELQSAAWSVAMAADDFERRQGEDSF